MSELKVTREMQDEMVRLYTVEKLAAPVIAERLGIGGTTVYRYLNRNGVPRGDAAEGAKRRGQRGRVYKHSPEVEKQICAEYLSGKSLRSLAEKYGYNLQGGGISKLLVRHGFETRKRGNTYAEVDSQMGAAILEMFEQGKSASAIGEQFGLTYQHVCRHLRSQGLNPNRGQVRGEAHPSWKGGRSISNGYVSVVLSEDSPYWSKSAPNGRIMEHRLVMAEYLGRPLQDWETVHHINGNRADNRIENLQLRIGKHGTGVCYRCMDCGSVRLEPMDLGQEEHNENN